MKRRSFMASLAAPLLAPALIGLTRKSPRVIAGGFVDDGGAAGHRIRDRVRIATPGSTRRARILVVGGGMAGLSAGWELDRSGMHDFTILELEAAAGGNARFGENEVSAYPWAAHYVPVPNRNSVLVRELFEDLGVLRDGKWEERYLCFSPQERLYMHGEWHAGIDPEFALPAAARAEFSRFDDEVEALRSSGHFTIPMELGVRRDSPLDRLSMSAWLAQRGLTSAALRWSVDYACRDDYGALASETSAWAGLHYFASRDKEEVGPITWPEGNGWIARRLIAKLEKHISVGNPVLHIARTGTRWQVMTASTTWIADAVVYAAPTFLLPYLIADETIAPPELTYSPWLTANLSLSRLPVQKGRGAPLSWDNVIYDSPALGYVDAMHQSLSTREDRSVWTYYWSLAEHSPMAGRRLLQQRTWADWKERILADLSRAHPDIRDCVTRMDIMRMGHAMVRPTVGFLAATHRLSHMQRPGFYLGNSDLSGLSLFEEAQFRGVAAARAAMKHVGG